MNFTGSLMMSLVSRRIVPIAQMVLVAAIWGSSFVGVKMALEDAGPLTIAALRYSIAAVLLLPWVLKTRMRASSIHRSDWGKLTLIGFSQYAIGNGALFLALRTVSSTAASLAISLVPIPIVFLEIFHLKEKPSRVHLAGIFVAVAGSVVFFVSDLRSITLGSLGLLALATISFAFMPVLGRDLTRKQAVSTIELTGIPLAIGGGALLVLAAVFEGLPRLPIHTWGIIIALAWVNTLAAYLLFNHALRRLHAGEANVLLNMTPVATAFIAWGAFGDRLTALQMVGIAVVILGATLAQRRRRGSGAISNQDSGGTAGHEG
jgi:drug/metabolite transporter (DMT)-like permease